MTEERVVNLRRFARHGRRGGIVLPPDVVRVDRGSPWGNPYRIGETWDIEEGVLGGEVTRRRVTIDRELAVLLYHGHAERRLAEDPDWLRPLRGKRLACWCSPLLCHADVLVELEAAIRPPIVVEGWPGQLTFGIDTVTPAMSEAPAWPRLELNMVERGDVVDLGPAGALRRNLVRGG